MKYRIIDDGQTVHAGNLAATTNRNGKQIKEAKAFFNTAEHLNHPAAEFLTDDKRVLTKLELKRTAKGYASTLYQYGNVYGCNFNRIKNRPGRWGVTVWEEPTDEKTAASI